MKTPLKLHKVSIQLFGQFHKAVKKKQVFLLSINPVGNIYALTGSCQRKSIISIISSNLTNNYTLFVRLLHQAIIYLHML